VRSSIRQLFFRDRGLAVAVVGGLALALTPAVADASPAVLEYVPAGQHFPVEFHTTSGPVSVELAGGAGTLDCTASSGIGQITGPRASNLEITYTGCTADAGAVKCQSTVTEGEVESGRLQAELVYLNRAKQEIGVVLNPTGEKYAVYECSGSPGVEAGASGAILARLEPVNQPGGMTFAESFDQLAGSQIPQEYETASGEKHMATPKSFLGETEYQSGTQATDTVTTLEPVDIKVVAGLNPIEEAEAKESEEQAREKKFDEASESAQTAQKQQQTEAAEKKLEEEQALAAAEKHGAEAAAASTARRSREEEAKAATRKEQEEQAAKGGQGAGKTMTKAQLLAEALTACKKQSKSKRSKCEASARKRYGGSSKAKKHRKK
jgi:hypothetical protein